MKSTLYFGLGLIFFAAVFSSCNNDDDGDAQSGTLEIYFEPVYGEAAEFIGRTTNFDYPTGDLIRFIVSDMYLGPLTLRGGSEDYELSDIEYINLSEPEMDSETNLTDKYLVFENVPTGIYSSLEIGVGVPEDLNSMAPSDFPAGHPLRRESHFWPPWNSFIFSKIEGRLDVDNDGSFGLNFIYHAGLDELYRTLQFDGEIAIDPGQVTRLVITVDHEKLFVNDEDDFLDIEANPIDHSAGDLAYMHYIADNYSDAIIVRILAD